MARPKKLDKKSGKITSRFTVNDFEIITKNAQTLKIKKSEYVSKMTIIGKIIDTYSLAQKDLVLRLINISNYLNQIAKAANTVGFKQVVVEVDALLVNIRQMINKER